MVYNKAAGMTSRAEISTGVAASKTENRRDYICFPNTKKKCFISKD